MTESLECDECGEEFGSERGLHIHQSRVHDEESSDGEEQRMDEDSADETGEVEEEEGLELDVRVVIAAVLLLGLTTGISLGILVAENLL